MGRSDPPLKKQLLPTSKETQTRKQLPQRKATASLEVAVEVAGRKPQGLAPKSRFQTREESPKYTRPPQNELTQQSSHLPGREPQEMESTNCPTDSGYELLVSGRVFRSIGTIHLWRGVSQHGFSGTNLQIWSLRRDNFQARQMGTKEKKCPNLEKKHVSGSRPS